VTRQSFHDDENEELPGMSTKATTPQSLVKTLAPPDSHYLNAAEGWLGLGDYQSALDELELIDPALRAHPDVLAVRCDIFTEAMKWPAVVAVASALVQLIPDRPSGWVRRSFALHGLKQTQQAFDLLLPAVRKFPEVSTIPYNLACYCAQLGGIEEARHWLHQSYEVGNAAILKNAARNDPDLAPLFVNALEL
jgi:tetratricopeptide (TPR) repeat protein